MVKRGGKYTDEKERRDGMKREVNINKEATKSTGDGEGRHRQRDRKLLSVR